MRHDVHQAPAGRRLIFWRHGRTAWNERGLFQGQQDIELDPVGRRQASRAAATLLQRVPSRIVSSDLSRAASTARELGRRAGIDIRLDKRLRETAAGRWEGLGFAEIAEQFPAENVAWRSGDPLVRAGGAENREEVGARVLASALEELRTLAPGQTLVLVSHGGAIRAGVAALMGLPSTLWGSLAGVSNCHWSVLDEPVGDGATPGSWQLQEHNVGLGSFTAEPLEG